MSWKSWVRSLTQSRFWVSFANATHLTSGCKWYIYEYFLWRVSPLAMYFASTNIPGLGSLFTPCLLIFIGHGPMVFVALHCSCEGILLWRYFEPVCCQLFNVASRSDESFVGGDEFQRPRCPWELLVPLSSRLPWPLNVQLTGSGESSESSESSQNFVYFELLWYIIIYIHIFLVKLALSSLWHGDIASLCARLEAAGKTKIIQKNREADTLSYKQGTARIF